MDASIAYGVAQVSQKMSPVGGGGGFTQDGVELGETACDMGDGCWSSIFVDVDGDGCDGLP